jgi:hypothetical protein
VRFFFHYNKPASRKAGRPVLSLHFGKKCHPVLSLTIRVPTWSKVRSTQPRIVMVGDADEITVCDGMATIS